MPSIYYPVLREALAAKICHFCRKPMTAKNTLSGQKFDLLDDGIFYEKEYSGKLRNVHLTGNECTSFADFTPIQSGIETTVFWFECKEHYYISDITLHRHPIKSFFIISCDEESVTAFNDNELFIIVNMFDINQTKIKKFPYVPEAKDVYSDPFFCDAMDDLTEDGLTTDLQKFPDTIDQLLQRTKIQLTFQ